jgi:hypothetical protein
VSNAERCTHALSLCLPSLLTSACFCDVSCLLLVCAFPSGAPKLKTSSAPSCVFFFSVFTSNSAPSSGIPPFPRPSPYANLAGLSSSAFGGLGAIGGGPFGRPADLPAIPGLTPPHEWNRLHRTPASFPTPPAWPKTEGDRDREKERSGSARPSSRSTPQSRDKREGSRDRESVEQLAGLGVTKALEVGPGTVLKGLVRRIRRQLEVQPAGTAPELAAASQHSG